MVGPARARRGNLDDEHFGGPDHPTLIAYPSACTLFDDHEIRPAGEPRLVGVGEIKVDVDVRNHLEMVRQLWA
jgi:hypothetical protein